MERNLLENNNSLIRTYRFIIDCYFILRECQRHLTRIIDEAGEASAKAQGLSKPITSAKKLRDTDHIIYLMVDSKGNK